MVSLEERLQIKREPLDKWSIREKLCLVSAVIRSGDQNWMSVSRTLKHFADPNRPSDWFHQKNCASQYGALLETVETPKRKKRTAHGESVIETPAEFLLRKLTAERQAELTTLLNEEKAEYYKLQGDLTLLETGEASDEQIERWCKELDEEEERKEQEAIAHTEWLKERELKKQEIERVWRPTAAVKVPHNVIGVKRKASELENSVENEVLEEVHQIQFQPEIAKPALSPLLTSLLKSPSQDFQNQVSNANTSSILHSVITHQRSAATNPTITSLLNSSATIVQQPNFQQLETVAVVQEPQNAMVTNIEEAAFLEDSDTLPNLKVEDIESTILSGVDSLPLMKTDEVEVIISDLMDHVDDIVNHPEQHIKLDGNDDIITNLENELKELCKKEEEEEKMEAKETELTVEQQQVEVKSPIAEEPQPVKEKQIDDSKKDVQIDPFEFQEDPEIFEPTKLQTALHQKPTQESSKTSEEEKPEEEDEAETRKASQIALIDEKDIKKEEVFEKKEEKDIVPGSVEIVEVVVLEDEEDEKQLNTSNIQDIVHSQKQPEPETFEETSTKSETQDSSNDTPENGCPEAIVNIKTEPSETKGIDVEECSESRRNTFTPDFSEEYYEEPELTKIDKSVKAKRDYSRTKKKEEKDFDILLAIEKAVNETAMEDVDLPEDTFSDRETDVDKKSSDGGRSKVKSETERSNSPWTEEEDLNTRSKRRYSTPATPVDSVPNSPASNSAYYTDDEKDLRTWKKSVMLVYGRMTTHKYASFFLKPITEEQAPGYHSLIYRPMDLLTIRKNIESGIIRSNLEFLRDVLLMFNNALMYNKTNSVVYNVARQMQKDCIQHIHTFMQLQNDAPIRRETRTSEPGNKRKRMSEDLTRPNKRKKED